MKDMGSRGPGRWPRRSIASWLAAFLCANCVGACIETDSGHEATPWGPMAQPEPLPTRPDDLVKFPREGFGFVLETNCGERIDTFAGWVTKDLVMLPDTTIELHLTEAELDTIWRKVIEVRLFDYPSVVPRDPRFSVDPSMTTHLSARAGTAEMTLTWESGVPADHFRDEWARLVQWIALIRQVVYSRPEYQALPRAKGAYL